MIPLADLKIETWSPGRLSGGQSVGVIPRGVRVTHVPSGMVESCDTERSQLKNRDACLQKLEARLSNAMKSEDQKFLKEPSAININEAVARACGWKRRFHGEYSRNVDLFNIRTLDQLQYTQSRDLMVEALALIRYEIQPYYLQNLRAALMKEEGVSEWEMITATAVKQAEAFLVTINQHKNWKV